MSSVRIGDNPGATSFPHTAAFLGIYFDDLRWASVPIAVDGRLAIPKGARASGFVKDAMPAGRFKGGAVLSLTLTSITVKNQDYTIQTTPPAENGSAKGKRTAGSRSAGFIGNRDITLAAETPLTFKLLEALEIKRRR